MLVALTVRHQGGGRYGYQFDQDEVLVGRDRATDVRLPHQAVSLVHLRLLRHEGKLYVVDAGSTNGTLLDGVALQPERKVVVHAGSRLQLGPFELRIGETPATMAPGPTAPADTACLARQIVCDVLGASSEACAPRLEVLDGPEQGQRLRMPLLGGPALVGRGEECALRLSDADASRKHCELRRKGEVVELCDLGSKNGVEINGQRMSGVLKLKHGDELRVGNTRLMFRDPTEQYLEQLEQRADESPKAQAAAAEQQPKQPSAVEGRSSLFGVAAGVIVLLIVGAAASLVYLLLGG